MIRKAVFGLCGLLAATIMQPRILHAEIISSPAVAIANKPENNQCFKDYLNKLSGSRYTSKEPTREDFERIDVYKMYYHAEEKKDMFEEKVMEGVNKSEWKDRMGIEKISTKFKEDNVKIQFRLKDSRSRSTKRDITIKKDFESERIEIRYNIRF